MRLDESFRYLCLTPQNTLLVTILKHFSVLHSVRSARLTIPIRPVRFSLKFGFVSVGSVLIPARPVSGSVVAELVLGQAMSADLALEIGSAWPLRRPISRNI